jgi:hypothetical protein
MAYFEARMMITMIITTKNFKMSSPHLKMLKAGYKIILPIVCTDKKHDFLF